MNVQKLVRYHDMVDLKQPKYDSIVDRTDFKKSQDKERAIRLIGDTGGSTTNGVYDFPDGNIDEKKSPTPVELMLRSGRLDKADIDTLSRIQAQHAVDEREEAMSEASKAQKEAIENARQSFIDGKTGFDPSSVGEK